MININFSVENPWSDRFNNLWCCSYATPFKNKFVELEVLKNNTVVSFVFRLTTRQDHSGLRLELGLLGYSFDFKFYDSRHWNYETNKWATYDTN